MLKFRKNTIYALMAGCFLFANLLLGACSPLNPSATSTPENVPSATATTNPGVSPIPNTPSATTSTTGIKPTATGTPPVSSGAGKGKLKEIFPVLNGLTEAKAIQINDDWGGLSPVAPTGAHYKLERKASQFVGEAVFSIGGISAAAFEGSRFQETARTITIPLAEAQKFLQMLAEAPVEEGKYKGTPLPTHTDDYPSLYLTIDTGAGSLQVYSTSQQTDFFPWSFNFGGREFTGTDAAAFQALKILDPYLQQDVLSDLIKKGNNTKPATTTQISPPVLNQATPDLLVPGFSMAAKSEATSSYLQSIALSPDGKILATGTFKMINLWSAIDGKKLATYAASNTGVPTLVFSPNGRYLAASSPSTNNFTWIWDIQAASQEPILKLTGSFVSALAFSPDGKTLASAGIDRTIRLWEFPSGRLTGQLRGKIPEYFQIYTIAFSPDGKTIAGAGNTDNQTDTYPVKLWDVASQQELPSLKGAKGPLYSLVFSPDGKTLASTGDEAIIYLWDMVGHKEQTRLTGQPNSGRIFSVAFSPDGKRLASVHQNGLLVLWDSATGKEISNTVVQPAKKPYDDIYMAYSQDGQFIFTGHRDGDMFKRWQVK